MSRRQGRTAQAGPLIGELQQLRLELARTFCETFSGIRDRRFLVDAPRTGILRRPDGDWEFARHGGGVTFTSRSRGHVVDVIDSVFDPAASPEAIEVITYAESRGLCG